MKDSSVKVLIHPNFHKQDTVPCTQCAAAKLMEFGAIPMLDIRAKARLGEIAGCVFGDFEALQEECDIIMAVGGDGTILKAVQIAVQEDKPVIGINAGRIGFLCQLEMHELDKLKLLVDKQYRISRRMMLEVEDYTGERRLALNDVVITQGAFGKLADIRVTRNRRDISMQRADGFIFSTPTGSTAYSLAAGGSIADPEMDLIVLTAISPYSAFNRSLILPATEEYLVREETIRVREGLAIVADGKILTRIRGGEHVLIRRSPVYAQFIDLQLRDFYTNLHEKLSLRR